MPDICDSGEGEQPFHLLESALEMDFSKGKERNVFFSGLEADEVISSRTRPCFMLEVTARSHGLAAHMSGIFFRRAALSFFHFCITQTSFLSPNNCSMARPQLFRLYLKSTAPVTRRAGEQGNGTQPETLVVPHRAVAPQAPMGFSSPQAPMGFSAPQAPVGFSTPQVVACSL